MATVHRVVSLPIPPGQPSGFLLGSCSLGPRSELWDLCPRTHLTRMLMLCRGTHTSQLSWGPGQGACVPLQGLLRASPPRLHPEEVGAGGQWGSSQLPAPVLSGLGGLLSLYMFYLKTYS